MNQENRRDEQSNDRNQTNRMNGQKNFQGEGRQERPDSSSRDRDTDAQSSIRGNRMQQNDRTSENREDMEDEEDTTLNTSGVQEGEGDEDREEDLRRRHSA
jgi:hypothetical protein